DLDGGTAYKNLDVALARGLIPEADLDRAVVRLFAARFRLGLFDPPERLPWSRLGADTSESPAHLVLAREVAERSIVLLDNRAGLLPLGPSIKRLAVVGPMGDDLAVLLSDLPGHPDAPVAA